MKLVCISDTHEQHKDLEIPDGDVLIHAGDATWIGDEEPTSDFFNWFMEQPHKNKIFIAGNHDFRFSEKFKTMEFSHDHGIHYLENEEINIGGKRFWGSPITPTFGDWAFMEDRGHRIRKYWNMIPKNIDALITHGPPMGILDETPRHQHVGCEDLMFAVEKVKPLVHIFGHIHHGYGRLQHMGITFVNASICDEDYAPVNTPIVVEI